MSVCATCGAAIVLVDLDLHIHIDGDWIAPKRRHRLQVCRCRTLAMGSFSYSYESPDAAWLCVVAQPNVEQEQRELIEVVHGKVKP